MSDLTVHTLPPADGFDAETQRIPAYLFASLEDQTALLREAVEGLEPRHLEWQHAHGHNTIGMLLAHMAIVECYWSAIAPKGFKPREADGGAEFRRLLGVGIEADGMPLAPGGAHPESLRGWVLGEYLALLEKGRACVRGYLLERSDTGLGERYRLAHRSVELSHGWTCYHILEHFSGHFGQVLLIRHQLRDTGLIPAKS